MKPDRQYPYLVAGMACLGASASITFIAFVAVLERIFG